MTRGLATVTAAAMCLCTSLFAFHPSAVRAQSAYESSGSLAGGGSYFMRRDESARTTAMELWFRAPAPGEDAKYPGISRLAITAVAASARPHGVSLSELVGRLGGTLSINVYPDIVMVGASVPSWDSAQVLRALTSSYFSPSITSDGLKSALRDCAVAAAESRFDAERVLQDALFAQLFSSGPGHYAPTPATTSDFTKIPEEAVKAFAQRAFRQNNATLSLAGNVNAQILSAVQAGNAGAPMSPPFDSAVNASPAAITKGSYVSGLGFAWTGAPISDGRAATALDFIADYLFDNEHGTLARALQKTDADTFVNGQFITLHDPGVLLLTIAGPNSAQLRQQVLDAVAALQHPMDGKTFDAARASFEYHLFSQMQTPMSRADNFGWYASEGNAAYAPGAASGEYLKAADSLDPDFVARVAGKYLQHPAIVQLISTDQKGTTT